jgi:DNA mismatch repair ATPase MutS
MGILLFRLGDFLKCFMEDAITASQELEITLQEEIVVC